MGSTLLGSDEANILTGVIAFYFSARHTRNSRIAASQMIIRVFNLHREHMRIRHIEIFFLIFGGSRTPTRPPPKANAI
jgi:hypothetical protein